MSQPDEIKSTPEQLQKLRLLSDGELYRMACKFIADNHSIDSKKQAVSLVAHTQTWDDIDGFVNKQASRDWESQTKYAGYKQFFQNLKSSLNVFRKRVEEEWFPPGAEYNTKDKRKAWINHFSIVVAREFLQHLEAENMYKAINQR